MFAFCLKGAISSSPARPAEAPVPVFSHDAALIPIRKAAAVALALQ